MKKLRLLSSCKYTHGVARRLLGPHDTLPCVLIYKPPDPPKQRKKKEKKLNFEGLYFTIVLGNLP